MRRRRGDVAEAVGLVLTGALGAVVCVVPFVLWLGGAR